MNKVNWIIIVCILVFVALWFVDSNELDIRYLAFSTTNLLNGRVWTLITTLFIHATILHLAGNMIFLFVFGNALEKEVGAAKTYLAFFVGGVFASLLGIFFYNPNVLLIGASAAIFTLTAVVMLVKPR
ncbi:MAG: rhomboid family intramembrane serine protease [Chloroflexota bacterium]